MMLKKQHNSHLISSLNTRLSLFVYSISNFHNRRFLMFSQLKFWIMQMIKPETHTPLIQFLQLLVAHHPSKRFQQDICSYLKLHFQLLLNMSCNIRCRRGSSEMLANFDDLWPSNIVAVSSAESVVSHENNSVETLKICGKEIPRGYWVSFLLFIRKQNVQDCHFWGMDIPCFTLWKKTWYLIPIAFIDKIFLMHILYT